MLSEKRAGNKYESNQKKIDQSGKRNQLLHKEVKRKCFKRWTLQQRRNQKINRMKKHDNWHNNCNLLKTLLKPSSVCATLSKTLKQKLYFFLKTVFSKFLTQLMDCIKMVWMCLFSKDLRILEMFPWIMLMF